MRVFVHDTIRVFVLQSHRHFLIIIALSSFFIVGMKPRLKIATLSPASVRMCGVLAMMVVPKSMWYDTPSLLSKAALCVLFSIVLYFSHLVTKVQEGRVNHDGGVCTGRPRASGCYRRGIKVLRHDVITNMLNLNRWLRQHQLELVGEKTNWFFLDVFQDGAVEITLLFALNPALTTWGRFLLTIKCSLMLLMQSSFGIHYGVFGRCSL